MILHFCRRQTAVGRPLKCFVYHQNHKIAEYVPDDAPQKTPIITVTIHGNHAYFYRRASKAQDVASHADVAPERKAYDEFSSRQLRAIYPRDATPLFSEWRRRDQLEDDMQAAFDTIRTKKRKTSGGGPAPKRVRLLDPIVYGVVDIIPMLERVKDCQDHRQTQKRFPLFS